MREQKQPIELTTLGILKVILVIVGVVLLYLIKDVIFIFLAALIIAAALDTPISWLQQKKVPRILGTILVYIAILIIFAGLLYFLLPPLATELKALGNNLPIYLEKIRLLPLDQFLMPLRPEEGILGQQQILWQLANKIAASASSIFSTTINIFGGFVSFIIVLVIAIYCNIQGSQVRKFVFYFVPKRYEEVSSRIIRQIRQKMGRWLWGRFLLSLFVGLAIFLGLSLLGVKYALLLAVLAGVLDIIPYIGPIIAAIPAVIIALLHSVVVALGVVLLYLIVNQVLENLVVQPLVMKKAVGVNPILLILAVLIGGRLAGLLGVIFAIPVVAILNVFIQEYMKIKKSDKIS